MGIIGIIIFAIGIAVSIALHEAGHMFTARAFGMRVRRYFIGFGPTLWSVKRGHTEYGIAALPLGGFCDIAGMTAAEPLTPEERPLAMYAKPWWQRVAVMSGGVIANILIAVVITYFVAVFAAIPNPYADRTPRVGELTCTADQIDAQTLAQCTGEGPAARAGVRVGDQLVGVDGRRVDTFAELRDYVIQRPGETVTLELRRGDERLSVPVELDAVQRLSPTTGESFAAGAIGLANAPVENPMASFGPLEAVPATLTFTGQMMRATVEGILAFPAKIPGVVASIFGAERDVTGPVSVIGASRAGGELVERSMWEVFWMMLASLNLFLALFNLIPLPPLDGGHIAVIFWEKLRDLVRRVRGLGPGGPVNYDKLMPVTYFMASLLLVVGVFVMVADVVNPVRLFG
ncbi:M50 family metallopeptidase [Corynebacterium lipophiloflavum]|uniref:Zinc metalloprotease Rip1 n=1 Tax=Corynebacterium lipophiloflavum (strain ATCC 700352 / DSM 44291 / CCUG 37336 / JCM 10383 / DMMZ 1944) TaxID=525263 RepID=C0XSC6_CORLD|nr:site-2 protease family protein [Corynebacterium lipophiloflavum]EEI16850.1 putative RIP metalloprotease RseP [Corynebacterium lipophiloflavum DSM 44291]